MLSKREIHKFHLFQRLSLNMRNKKNFEVGFCNPKIPYISTNKPWAYLMLNSFFGGLICDWGEGKNVGVALICCRLFALVERE